MHLLVVNWIKYIYVIVNPMGMNDKSYVFS